MNAGGEKIGADKGREVDLVGCVGLNGYRGDVFETGEQEC